MIKWGNTADHRRGVDAGREASGRGFSGRDGDTPESSRGPVAGVSVLLALVLFGFCVEPGRLLPGPAAVLMLLVQLITCLPWTRRLRGAWALAAQIVLAPWAGLPGFLAASVLLAVERPLRWALFTLVVLAAGPLAPGDGGVFSVLNGIGNAFAHGLVIYALSRLTDLYAELHATRGTLAAARVAAERRRNEQELEEVLGTALVSVIAVAGRGRQAARELVALARAAAERVRAAPPVQRADRTDASPQAMTPRLAWPIVIATHLEYLAVGAAFLLGQEIPGWRSALYAAALTAVIALQAYHSLPRPPGVRPRHAPWTLGAQITLALGMLALPDGPYPQLTAFAAASTLIVLPARAAWPAATALTAVTAVGVLTRPDGPGLHGTAVLLLDIVVIALVFYGLALLTGLVHQVREAREALASLAVAQERRRIAQDVHDLLGHGLSAIALKGELAVRDPDPQRADGHLTDAARLARRALADLRAIPGQGIELTLDAELASVRQVLASAGITLRVRGNPGRLEPAAEALFATVLREAATNVLRHGSAPCRCTIAFEPGTLRVTNRTDGTPSPLAPPAPQDIADSARGLGGNGIRNLHDRAALLGAHLESGPTPDGHGYALTLRLQPSPAAPVTA
ncbi:sensor histidine kinase [Streptomyces sp. NPDC056944]|uniref:sensor histidine kinase n=1 Tax=Streptomyces sp. NPDC056944 TaxID=3345972 RepID=UPI003643E506